MINDIFGKIKLNDGHEMPGYGFGVYKAGGKELLAALAEAYACGYRYIDTAAFYENEDIVGKSIRKCGLPRSDLFIVSKIWPTSFHAPVKSLDKSLKLLGLDCLDGFLLHWPGLDQNLRLKTWEAMMREQEKGKIKVLGVSNFLQQHLVELHDNFGIWAPVNQIEVHVHYQQKELRAFCADHKIQVISWAPLGRGHGPDLPGIEALAREKGRTPAQIILRWQVQNDLVPIPKSVHAKRIGENADVFDFSLTAEEMAKIDNMDLPGIEGRTGNDPLLWPTM